GTNDGAWGSNIQSVGVPVILKARSNTVSFSNPSDWAPDIDRVTVSGSGYVAVANRATGKYLDVSGASTADLAKIVQNAGNGQVNQQWSLADAGGGYFKLANRNSGKVLNIPGPTTTQGTQLIQFFDDGNANSQWALTAIRGGSYDIVSRYDSQNVDVQQGSAADGTPVIQFPNNGGANQQWSFVGF
ncbi:MAG TPA: RICIN domain-containing protein, partial [Polyangiaceae bacterium]|nr:RICIN domain-containing protein [Polyangiaceae bacterium]